jgi:phosphatidylglycerophosphate synthase
MPRIISFRNNKTILIINSNIITLLRTLLFIPIVWFLKHNYSVYACWTVVLHSFFGTFDGIVARVHGGLYPNQDDPVRSRFLIAFCNKIVNLLIFIVLMQTINFSNASNFETMVFCSIIYCVIIYDVVVAVLRVQSYFEAILIKEKANMASKATLEWKLKTKLESVGISALCLASDKSHENPVMNFCMLKTYSLFNLFFTKYFIL